MTTVDTATLTWNTQAPVQTALDAAERLQWSVIPLDDDKRPCKTSGTHPDGNPKRLGWKRNQEQRASKGNILNWNHRYHPSAFAIIAGKISNRVILDFDGEQGRATMERLGLHPHVRTGSGGYHVYFQHPGWHVRTYNSKSSKDLPWAKLYPGMDIRGDGGYAAFCGKNVSGPYTWLRDPEPDDLSILPEDLRAALGLLNAPDEAIGRSRPDADTLIERALAKIGLEGRNDAGWWLACQLRDNGYAEHEARAIMTTYQQRTPPTNTKGKIEPYTIDEALASVRSAYSRPAREAWRDYPSDSTNSSGNGNSANNGAAPADEKPRSFNLTDLGNAERFVALHGENLRYCHSMNAFIVWNGKYWQEDKDGQAERLTKKTVRAMYAEAASIADEKDRKALASYALRSESKKAIRDMIALAQSEIPLSREAFNTHPWLLNCANGTLDLRTGKLEPHHRAHFLTSCLSTRYNPVASCPKWLAFLETIFAGDEELITFIQRAIGYALTGDTSEQCFFLLHGAGQNGKSTLLEVLKTILGDYAQAADFKAFLAKDNEGIRNDIARMDGKRLVMAKETDKGRQLAEALVKSLTGGDTITARFLRQEYFDFKPQFKLFLAANHKPEIQGTDLGIWRRIRLIPFTVQIAPDQVNKHLQQELVAEAEGILAWAVQGCLDWQRDGLNEPAVVRNATDAYRDEMDDVKQFLSEQCEFAPGLKIQSSELNAAFTAWQEGEKPNLQQLKQALKERGLKHARSTGGRYVWHGIQLKPGESEPPQTESEPSETKSEPSEGESERESEPSEPSEVKKGINYAKATNIEIIPDSTSLGSLVHSGSLDSFGDTSVPTSLESPVAPCQTAFETLMSTPHGTHEAMLVDATGNHWCENCVLQHDLMNLGAERGYPVIHVKTGRPFNVQPGYEQWLRFAIRSGYENVRAALAVLEEKA